MFKHTKIHLDLESINIAKTDIDKITFGLFKYAVSEKYEPPFIFTANTQIKDVSYLGVLKIIMFDYWTLLLTKKM